MTLEELRNDLLAEMNGCPVPAIDRALLQTTQDACRDATVLTQDLPAINTVAGTSSYALTAPANTYILRINKMHETLVGGGAKHLTPSPVMTQDRSGTAEYFWTDGLSVFLNPVPDAVKTYNVSAVLVPKTLAGFPVNLIVRESSLLREGALYRLRRQLNESWGNPQLATAHFGEYRKFLGDARKRVLQGQVGARLTTQYRRLGF